MALTRAKLNATISYSKRDSNGKDLAKAVYVVEADESDSSQFENRTVSKDLLESYFVEELKGVFNHYHIKDGQDFIQPILDNLRINATNLNAYLKCPVSFFYQNIIRVPSAKSESMTFGTAIHNSLEKFFNLFPLASKDALKEYYKDSLSRNKESFTKESYDRKLFYGQEVLSKFYDEYYEQWNSVEKTLVELDIKNVELNGVPIRGKIDKVNIVGESATVVDYKTGKYENGKKKLKPPKEQLKESDKTDHNLVYGGDYWRQLIFYKILIDADPDQKLNVTSGIIDFVEPDTKGFHQFKMVISDADLQLVSSQIVDVYNRIQNREFTQGCNNDDCQWCNFQKHYLKNEIPELIGSEDFDDQEIDER